MSRKQTPQISPDELKHVQLRENFKHYNTKINKLNI
jgi:ribosomal protein S30